MKRYQGRRAKPNLSEWCATKRYRWELGVPAKRGHKEWQPIWYTGHSVCRYQRHHHPDHLDCCGSPDERESYACECPCHPVRPEGFGGRG